MGDEKDILERLSAVEVQVKDIQKVQEKLDQLYNLVMDMKLESASSKTGLMTRLECSNCKKELEKRMEHIEEGRRKLFWMSMSSGIVFMLWLIEELLHLSIKVGP
jgi:hypothetical protein